ncbi:MAG TPA: 3-hydroxyacyl-CoA dehydrogenase/enoyl-CoA hydratase family protein [Rhodospirillales bacterium]|nr:3-hydroxyacyl-CoA dehydrogenase/enoyl-CoA hydratase family protein [Rhodospirillales bacterium]
MTAIEKVAVIGAGVMGAGIAAHIANAGVPVTLLDIVTDGADNRNAVAEGAVAKLLKADPSPLMHKRNAKRITPGNIEDHLDQIADCDWIIEAVIERIDIKRNLYERLEKVRKAGSIVSSNTSTIPLAMLTDGMPERLGRDFVITHFFNPPRYMRLLEVVTEPDTRGDALEAVCAFADTRLGKTVINCKDTPGFIANRIGTYWLQCAVVTAVEDRLSVEEVDVIIGRPMGIPKTGVFALLDMVGLDLMPHVLNSLAGALPANDPFHAIYREPKMIEEMIAAGYTGRKGKGGFYRLDTSSGKRVKQARDLATGEYRDATRPKLASVAAARKGGLRALVEHADKGGAYAWKVLAGTLGYAAGLATDIADDIVAVDAAMCLGYNWKFGPFELIDKLGARWFRERLEADGLPVPELLRTVGDGTFYRTEGGRLQYLTFDGAYADVRHPPGVLLLADVKRRGRPLARNGSASLWDIGDGVLCLEFHSKMNALDPRSLAMVTKAIELVPRAHKALVVYNEGSNFSVGANIGLLLIAAKLRLWFVVRWMVGRGQRTYKALKYTPFPVVAAPSGMALGGGCEVLLHSDAVQAHGETYTGLVETGVGVIPGWGGCKEMLFRWFANPDRPGGPMPPVTKVFETIGLATVARSAEEARDSLFLRPDDGITMNRDRLLADAKTKALSLVEDYTPPQETEIPLPGETATIAIGMVVDGFHRTGKATPHDVVVSRALAGVVSGGATDITEFLGEDEVLSLERDAFVSLAREPATIARISHMLKTGKPLRN